MKWRLDFYSEPTGILARYAVEATGPAAALQLGRRALLAAYPPPNVRRAQNLFDQARRIGGQNPDGWVLYRIAKDE